ncbi:HNH endonuclease signature motif containing protein [Microbacterium gorillae]|uniref:HNH endonuclease signature motif containing protein n=1 Tax=Microbacterium gorillae TaxID=1231063 RepID=UPI0006940936|nr:HNH endonuclease signature motif containing protein [Microbacterium gorillae]
MTSDTNTPGRGSDARLRVLVADVVRVRAEIARLQARDASLCAAVLDVAQARAEGAGGSGREHDLTVRDVSAELGTALRVSDRVIQSQLSDAFTLVHRFPLTHAALAGGRISLAHARAIIEAGCPIEDETRRGRFEAEAVPIAEAESTARLRRRIAMTADAARTDSINERHQAARAARCVEVRDGEDGMSDLYAHLPTVEAHGIADRLHATARRIKNRRKTGGREATATVTVAPDGTDSGDGTGKNLERDERTLAQIQADVFADLLLTADPTAAGDGLTGIRAHVQVNIPVSILTTTTTEGEGPPTGGLPGVAELVGHGPIDTETARALAGNAPGWDRLFVNPTTGHVLEIDRYQPSADQRRILRVRDEHCRFPGCRYPAIRSDADHTIDAAHGGPTAISNLGHFCRRHHTLKHHTRWKADNLPGGLIRWTSPLGVTYIDKPPRTVVFPRAHAPSDPPPRSIRIRMRITARQQPSGADGTGRAQGRLETAG